MDLKLLLIQLKKFTRGGDYSLSSSINTKIYGLTQFKKGKICIPTCNNS